MASGARESLLAHPGRTLVAAFLVVAVLGTVLLALPVASSDPGRATWLEASFTAVSALTLTGLVVVDTGTHWSGFGQVVILALIQLGGFGIVSFGSLFALVVFRRIGLRGRMLATEERSEVPLGGVRGLLRRVLQVFAVSQGVGFVLLSVLFYRERDEGAADALWQGFFYAISGFNGAGFATFDDSLEGFATAPAIIGVIAVLILVGSIGFPVVLDVAGRLRQPRRWTLHTKLTVATTLVLLGAGTVGTAVFEWTNPGTLGELGIVDRVSNAFFAAVTRTAGFSTFDYGEINESTVLLNVVLMFIGGGSASAAAGIKVTTFALLAFVIWAEVRARGDVVIFGRRIAERTQRQALTVALVGVGLLMTGTILLSWVGDFTFGEVLFEAASALATVGLSTGITAELPVVGHAVLMVLMVLGRLGPVTVGTALVLRSHERRYRYPEGRPLIG